MTVTSQRGWGFPGTSRKAHYFTEDGRSDVRGIGFTKLKQVRVSPQSLKCLKESPMRKVLPALLILVVALMPMTAHAWNAPICNPATGEVKQPSDFHDEAAYNKYLQEHQGSFVMGAGETCHTPTVGPSPTPDFTPTPTPSSTPVVVPSATPAPTSPPSAPQPPAPTATPPVPAVVGQSPPAAPTPPWDGHTVYAEYCVQEVGTGQWTIRHTTNTTLPGPRPAAPHVCAQDTEQPVPTATAAPAAPSVPVTSSPAAVATPEAAPAVIEVPLAIVVPPMVPPAAEQDVPAAEQIETPAALPATGDPDTLSYCSNPDPLWWAAIGSAICP